MKKLLLSFIFMASSALLFCQIKKVVAQDGSGDFNTVQAAINSLPDDKPANVIIFIKKGSYKECITISKSKTFIRFIGENVKDTKLTFDNYNSKKDSTGKYYGTTGSSSIFVDGDNITFENIKFENSSGPVRQAVAVDVTGNKVGFRNCRFLGFQDTIRLGKYNTLVTDDSQKLYAFSRKVGNEEVIVIINRGNKPATFTQPFLKTRAYKNVFTGKVAKTVAVNTMDLVVLSNL